MRRIVPSCIAEALERARPALEEYIVERLQYPEVFPYHLAPAALSILEYRKVKVAALAKADYPI